MKIKKIILKCIICNNRICQSTARYGRGMCISCAKIKHGETLKNHYCIDCGKEISNYQHKRCNSCSAKFKHENGFLNAQGRNNGRYNPEKHKKYYCKELNCNNEITYETWLKGKRRCNLCSYLGENNPNWQGGKSFESYSIEWTKELRELIRKRDNFTCQYCGITQEEHLKKYKQVLHIHHIDYDKFNCKETNLITACIKCNPRANYNRDYWYAYYTYKMENIIETIKA